MKSAMWAVVSLLSLVLPSSAQTGAGSGDILTPEERAWLAAHPTLVLSPDPAYQPVEFFDEQGVFRGIAADYIALIEQRLGFRFQIVNRDKEQEAFRTGRLHMDAMPTCAATPERERTWVFTTPYLEFPTYIITRNSVSESLTLKQLSGSRVAVVGVYAVREYLEKNYPNVAIDPVPDARTGLQKVSFGLVDAFVSELPVATYWMEREGITNLKTAGEAGYVYRLGFGMTKEVAPLHGILEKGLAQITPGERAAIYQKWVRMPIEPSPFNRRLALGLLGGLSLAGLGLLCILWWNRSLAAQIKQRTAALQQELTERKEIEKQLRASEERFQTIFRSSPTPLGIARFADGEILDVNDRWVQFTGYSREELVGKLAPETELWQTSKQRPQIIRTLVQERQLRDWEVEYQTKSGEQRIGNLSVEVLNLNGELCNLWAVLDMTDRKKAEEALQQSEALFRSLTESTSAWVFIAQGTKLRYFNTAAEAGTGYARAEIADKEIWAVIHPDDYQLIRDRIAARQQGLPLPLIYEARVLTKAGEMRWMQVTTTRIEYEGAPAELSTAFDITDRKCAEESLQQSEELFRSLTESTSAWVFIVQAERLTYVNAAAEAGIGYSRAELVGQYLWLLVPPEDHPIIQERIQRRIQGLPLAPHYEVRIINKAGEERWLQISSKIITYQNALADLSTAFDITERKRAEEQLKISEQQLHQLAGYLQTAREQERTNIAREIHDELGQAMTALKMDLSWLTKRMPEEQEPVQQRLKGMIDLVNDTITTVRRLATQLRPGILDDLGLQAALEWQAYEFQTRTGIVCDFVTDADVSALAPERATAIFRICQEALTNVARHAAATRVNIHLQEEQNQLRLEVRDNGRGISTSEKAHPRSLGLLGMRERAFLLGGEVQLMGCPSNGTTVTARIPRYQTLAKGGAS